MTTRALEIWLGIECSVVRVQDRYVDQVVETGHATRLDDLDRLAALGATAVRYPVLWERTAPGRIEDADWSFADERLERLRELGIRPIVGLVHHGSGPRWTNLLDDSFVDGLATFARAVAERYPWVLDYTPINEPLTTARFSALYGHWYPHERSDAAFVRALLVECQATRAAMRAIRGVTPGAQLIQTEDFATVLSTSHLAYQAHFENLRRFASLDILTGKLDASHPMHRFFIENGAPPEMLDSFVGDPSSPDVIGINYYVTSDRFLDERTSGYPADARGSNHREPYADVEAVRVCADGIVGHRGVLQQTWDRYHLPLAFTEVHLGCAPEEQIRWLHEAWRASLDARASGIDVRAVTPWSVFGACDWDSLLVEKRGHYEPGLFDVSGGCVRPTALASVARELAATGESTHPLVAAPGWWRREDRLIYAASSPAWPLASASAASCRARAASAESVAPPIMITGAAGTLGRAVARICEGRRLPFLALTRAELDVTDAVAVARAVERIAPWAVVNAAGYVRVDDAEDDRDRCLRENAHAVFALARACADHGVRFATFSSDLVFDGSKRAAYVESDRRAPLGVYGESKALAEQHVAELCPRGLVIRTSAFFGPWDEWSFVRVALRRLRAGEIVHAATDQVVSPTYVPDLANATLSLLVDGAEGTWHVANAGAVSWFHLAALAAELDGAPTRQLRGRTTSELAARAARPAFSALASERGLVLPDLADALRRFFTAGRIARDPGEGDRAPIEAEQFDTAS
jgi:dTDP-4-dehydrorhamnose reductase